jgi:HlyD family secretion protein
MTRTKKVILMAGLAAILVGSIAWVATRQAAQSPERRYKVATLEQGEVIQTVSANGTLNPVVLVNVGTQVSGTVRKLYVDFNDKVEKGQALLELDDALLAAQVRQSEANVANAAAAVELAQANEARIKSLFAQEYVSRQEYDQSRQALKSTQAQLALAKAQLDKDRVNHGNTTIRSPVSGVVVDRVIDLGQTVAASFQTPTLIKIAQDLSEMRIDTSFAEADIGNLREGQKARFTVDAFPNRHFIGEVQQIRLNPTNQQNVVTYNVRVTVDNPEQVLLPGMTAYVSIAVAQRGNVLLVPNAALRFRPSADVNRPKPADGQKTGKKRDGQSATVYVLSGDDMRPVTITLGITDNRNTEVISGDLKTGDRVVTGDNLNSDKKPSSVGMRLF